MAQCYSFHLRRNLRIELMRILGLLLIIVLLQTGNVYAQTSSDDKLSSLVNELSDHNIEVRRNAAEALMRMGPEAKNAAPALSIALKDEDERVRYYAAQALGRMGTEAKVAVPNLGEALNDSNRDVRQSAAWAIGKIGADAKSVTPALLGALKDQDKDVRRTAAWALAITGAEKRAAVPVLLEALHDSEDSARETAARALGRIGAEAKSTIPALIDTLQDPNQDVRRIAATAIGSIAVALQHANDISSLDQLRTAHTSLKEHSDRDVRDQAESVQRAITALELARARSFKETLRKQVYDHPYIALAIALEPILLLVWLVLLCLRPLWLLRINDALRHDVKVSNKLVEVTLPFRYLILVGFFHYHRRVLDKWVIKYIESARSNFAQKSTVEERQVYVPLPVAFEKENIASLTPKHLQPTFLKNRACLLIWGEGGKGKTSLACEVAKWAMSGEGASRLYEKYLMLPVLIEQDIHIDTQNSKRPLLEAVRGQLTDLIDESEPVSEELLMRLLKKKRVLVIIDGLSEFADVTRNNVRPGKPDFLINALVVTSRVEEDLDKVRKTKVSPLLIQRDRLSVFMEAYLKQCGKRELFNDVEYFDACLRLSLIVGDRNITVLLAKLYAEQMIASKEEPLGATLPENIPDLMLHYLNYLNRTRGDAALDTRLVHDAVKAVAWECVRQGYRPKTAKRMDLLFALKAEENPEDVISYLEDNLRLLQKVGPHQDRYKFTLDPLAEYLAGLHLVERNGESQELWQEFLSDADGVAGAPDSIKEFLLAVRECCMARMDEIKSPAFVLAELTERVTRDLEVEGREPHPTSEVLMQDEGDHITVVEEVDSIKPDETPQGT